MTRDLIFCILMSLVTSQVQSTEQCRPVYSQMLRCLSRNRPTVIDISCTDGTLLDSLSAAVYQAVTSVCPSHYQPTDCHHRTISPHLYPTKPSFRLKIAPDHPDSATAGCGVRNASRYVIITYRCADSPSIFLNSSSIAVPLTDNSTHRGSLIAVTSRNPMSKSSVGLTDLTGYYCSLYVADGDVDIEVRFSKFPYEQMTSVELTSYNQRVELWDGQSKPLVFYRDTKQPQLLPCTGTARSFKVTYINADNTSNHVFFLLELRVRHGSDVIAQCGHPPFPLFKSTEDGSSPSTTTTLSETTASTRGNSKVGTCIIVIVFIVVGLIALVTVSFLVIFCCRSRRQTRSLSSDSEASSVDMKDVDEKSKSTTGNIYVDLDKLSTLSTAKEASESKI